MISITLGIAVLILVVYRLTASPTIGWVDSGVIAAAANTLGIPNPPGFPAYLLIANVFTKIPWGTVVSRLQLLSQLSAVGIVLLVYGMVAKYSSRRSALFAAIALAFSYGLWQQANNVETYTVTNFALFLILFIAWQEKPKWWLIGLLLGVGAGLNPTIVAVIPGILVIARSQRRRSNLTVRDCFARYSPVLGFAALAMTLLGFIAIYSYLPIRAASHPFVNWGDPVNWERITKHLFGAGLNIYEPETNSINGFTGQPIIFWESFLHYWHLAIFQFTPLLFPLVVIGAWQMIRKNVFAFSMLAAIAGTNMLFVVLYYGGNQESWMITSWVVMAVWMGMGVDFVLLSSRDRSDGVAISHQHGIAEPVPSGSGRRLLRFARNDSEGSPRNDKLKIAVLALSLLPLLFWYPILDHSKFTYADDYANNLYKNVPEGAIIVGGGDFFNSLTAYTHEVTKFRKDIIPVTGNMFYIFDWYRKNLTLNTDITISASTSSIIKYKSVDEFTDAVDSLVTDNPKKQVFVTPLLLRDSVVAGTRDGNYHTKKYDLLPHGLLLKVVPKGSPELPDDTILANVSFGKPPYYLERNYKNAYRLLRNDYAAAYQLLGDYWSQIQQPEKAYQAFAKSIDVGPPDSPEFIHRLAIFYAQTGQNEAAKTTFEKALALAPDDAVIKQNYQGFLGSTASTSATPVITDGTTKTGPGFSFTTPPSWKTTQDGAWTVVTAPDGSFSLKLRRTKRPASIPIETFLGGQATLSGQLLEQGLAKIPNTDVAYVKVWAINTTNQNTKLQFFLFIADAVVE
ncbi:MAG: DUF2723 domain-containing protein, partial [Patescibacteria group bacterium]